MPLDLHASTHYGKNMSCRAANHCRAPMHGKNFFDVRSKQHARQRKYARQRLNGAHNKENMHGKVRRQRTAKKPRRQRPNTSTTKNQCTAKALDVVVAHPLSWHTFYALVCTLMDYMYLLYLGAVLHILLLRIYIIYIELCAGNKQNSKKLKITVAFAMCMHTAKNIWSLCRVHVARSCAPGSSLRRAGWGHAGRQRINAQQMRSRSGAHDKGPAARQRRCARQSLTARQKPLPHGKASPHSKVTTPHGKELLHGNESGARQRASRTAKPLPCASRTATYGLLFRATSRTATTCFSVVTIARRRSGAMLATGREVRPYRWWRLAGAGPSDD